MLLGILCFLVMIFLYFIIVFSFLLFTGLGSVSLILGASFNFSLVIDKSSSVFRLTLFLISISVLLWAYYYMDSEVHYRLFVSLVLCFLFAMFGLVLSGSLLTSFVF